MIEILHLVVTPLMWIPQLILLGDESRLKDMGSTIMRLAHLFNVLALFSVALIKTVRLLGK